jgi:hypothetical protein
MPRQLNALVVDSERLNLCSAQINPNAHLCIFHQTFAIS